MFNCDLVVTSGQPTQTKKR